LPAKAVSQSTDVLPDMTPSLASQRLQGVCAGHKKCGHPPSTVGAGLPAKAVCQSTDVLADMTPSLASQLLQGAVYGAVVGLFALWVH
jgi:hypothetical protein